MQVCVFRVVSLQCSLCWGCRINLCLRGCVLFMAVLHPFPSISLSLPQPDLSGTSAWGPSLSSTYFCTSFPLFCDPAGIRATLLMANCLVSQKPRGWKGSFKRCVCDLYLWRILFTVCVCVLFKYLFSTQCLYEVTVFCEGAVCNV